MLQHSSFLISHPWMIAMADNPLQQNGASCIEETADGKVINVDFSKDIEDDMDEIKLHHGTIVFKKRDQHDDASSTASDNTEISGLRKKELDISVFRKAVHSLLYPTASFRGQHSFETFTAKKPTYCSECQSLLWGLVKQGVRCSQCHVKCHDRCRSLIDDNCRIRVMERKAEKSNDKDRNAIYLGAIGDLLNKRQVEMASNLQLLNELFNDLTNAEREKALGEVKTALLEQIVKWSATVSVTVVSAQNLANKDFAGTSDPYVTLQLGRTKHRTQTKQNTLTPVWNESFKFECRDPFGTLKIRVWDEDNDLKAKLRQKTKGEADNFLGESIIDISKLTGLSETLLDLAKRTSRSNISGAIFLRVQVTGLNDDEDDTRNSNLYFHLHEKMFQFYYDRAQQPSAQDLATKGGQYFEPKAMEIVSAFVKRYRVEKSQISLAQLSCLTPRLGNPSALRTLNEMFWKIASIPLETSIPYLTRLYRSIKQLVSDYRNMFPADDSKHLKDLDSAVQLLQKIALIEKQTIILNVYSILEDCIKENAAKTYRFLFENCNMLYEREFAGDVKRMSELDETVQPKNARKVKKGVRFWDRLVALIVLLVEDDRNSYSECFRRVPSLTLHDLTAVLFWSNFEPDLKESLVEHATHLKLNKPDRYMKLHFKVQWLFQKYVSLSRWFESKSPEYPEFFETFVIRWLNVSERVCLECSQKAYDQDSKEGFQRLSAKELHSFSVSDIFRQFSSYLDIIKKLDCPNPTLRNVYFARLAKTIQNVIGQYVTSVSSAFRSAASARNQSQMCTLVNNVDQTKVNVGKIVSQLGGRQSIDKITALIVQEICEYLDEQLDRFCKISAELATDRLTFHFKEMVKLFYSNQTISDSRRQIVRPLTTLLDEIILVYAENCGTSVLRTFLKNLWTVTLQLMSDIVVMPRKTAKTNSSHNLNQDNCMTMNEALEMIKNYFHGNGEGLNVSDLESSQPYQFLLIALCLYPQSTDSLIKAFIHSQQQVVTAATSVGIIRVSIAIQKSTAIGEMIVDVNVFACQHLNQPSSVRPYVVITLVGLNMADKKSRWETKCKLAGNINPVFNESHKFKLKNSTDAGNYELQFTIRDFQLGAEDKIVGLAVAKLVDVINKPESKVDVWLPLDREIRLDVQEDCILAILSSRANDELAIRFATLKTEKRQF